MEPKPTLTLDTLEKVHTGQVTSLSQGQRILDRQPFTLTFKLMGNKCEAAIKQQIVIFALLHGLNKQYEMS